MRGYTMISDEEKNSILQQHSSFYNGYAVGNVPNEPQPLRVGKGASDPNGITVDNKGNVKTYQNHKINESVISEDVNENEDILKNYSALIGYVIGLRDSFKGKEYTVALNELKMYYESLRDGKNPKPLSDGGQVAKEYVEKEIVKLNDSQITQLEKDGGGKTRSYGNEDILKNYKALIGFVQFLSDKFWGDLSIEQAAGFKELSIYYENLRDGRTPKPLSNMAQANKEYVEKEIMKLKLNDTQIKKLESDGSGNTRLYEMDMDISDEESAYSFKSDGPEQFDSSYSDDSYGLDIDSIMQMFGGDMSPAEYDDMDDMMNSHMDGKEKFHDEDEAYEFDSEGGDAAVYYEEEQCEGCGEMMEEKEICNECGSEMMEGECMECGSLYEEMDEELHESFKMNRRQIKEMFNKFKKYN